MAKKKAMQKDTQSIIITVIVIIAALAIVGAGSIMSTVNMLSDTVVTVNGEKISKPYFNFFLYSQKLYYESFGGADIWGYSMDGQQTAEQSAKDSALNTAVSMKISKQQAALQNLQLTSEDTQQIETSLAETKASLGEEAIRLTGLTDTVLNEILSDQILADKIYEEVTKDYVMNPDEFETYFQDYLIQNRQTLTQIDADYIHTDTLEAAAVAKAEIDAGTDFVEVLKATSVDYDPATEYASIQVSTGVLPQEAVDAAFNLTAGQVSEIVETESQGCYIVRVNTVTEPDEAALRPEQETTYTDQQKQEIFDAQFSTWSADASITTNADLLQAVSIASISPAATPAPTATFSPLVPATEGDTDETAPAEGEMPVESEPPVESEAPAN